MTNNPDHYYSENPKTPPKFGIIRTTLRNRPFEFLTASSVFSVKRVDLGTSILIESMVLPETGNVLDVGCGYGVVGIAAATFNKKLRVIMTDVNRRAVVLSRQNAEKNRVHNVEVRQGDLYEPVQDFCFNCILSNPPVSSGMNVVEAIIRNAPKVMASKATLQMVVRSKIGKKTLPEIFFETFGNFQILSIESGYRVLVGQKN
jgi:16S rRNA (guanine1207-N2)-methyltransferase